MNAAFDEPQTVPMSLLCSVSCATAFFSLFFFFLVYYFLLYYNATTSLYGSNLSGGSRCETHCVPGTAAVAARGCRGRQDGDGVPRAEMMLRYGITIRQVMTKMCFVHTSIVTQPTDRRCAVCSEQCGATDVPRAAASFPVVPLSASPSVGCAVPFGGIHSLC